MIDYHERDDDHIEVGPDEIEASESIPELEDWFHGIELAQEHIRGQLLARREAGIEDHEWVNRCAQKLGYYGMGLSRIRRRIKDLGGDINPNGTKIDELNRKLQVAKASAAFAHAFVEAARHALPEHEYLLYVDRANNRIMPKARAA